MFQCTTGRAGRASARGWLDCCGCATSRGETVVAYQSANEAGRPLRIEPGGEGRVTEMASGGRFLLLWPDHGRRYLLRVAGTGTGRKQLVVITREMFEAA